MIAALLLLLFREYKQEIKMHLDHENNEQIGFIDKMQSRFCILHIETVGQSLLIYEFY